MYYNQIDVISVRQFDVMDSKIISREGCYNLIFVLEGTCFAVLNGENLTARKDELLILRPAEFVYVKPDRATEFRAVQVVFRLSIPKLVSDIEKCHTKQDSIGKIIRPIMLKLLSDAIIKPQLYRDTINLSVTNLLLEIIINDSIGADKRTCIRWISPPPSGFNHCLYTLLEYIDAHIDEAITVKRLVDCIHGTPSSVGRLFKMGLNITPLQYINTVRLNRAKELMMCSDMNITEVARHTGFKSIHYFSRYFKEKEKITPLEFKEQLTKNVSVDLRNNMPGRRKFYFNQAGLIALGHKS